MRRLARDRIAVECCLSSNYHTGAVQRGAPHPIHAFLEAGVPVAICCDNSTVSRTDALRESAPRRRRARPRGGRARSTASGRPTRFIRPETALATRDGD